MVKTDKMKKRTGTPFSFYLDELQLARLKQIAKRARMPMSYILRQGLDIALDAVERQLEKQDALIAQVKRLEAQRYDKE